MLSKKHQDDLKRRAKRRALRPQPQIVAVEQLKAPAKLENRMIRDHQDVLQNIEFALVSAYRDGRYVDDAVVDVVLQAAIRGNEPSDPSAEDAFYRLMAIRRTRDDVSDEVWTDGLRVVYASLKRHSDCRRGETSYLDFVSPYVL